MSPKISKNQVALAGEFAALSQLALRGFDANLTLGNTKSVDILVSNPRTKNMFRLEVKTHSKNKPYNNKDFGRIIAQWRLSEKHEKIIDDKLFYCFVSIQDDNNSFNFYIVPSKVVADYVTRSHKYWLSIDSKRVDNPMRAFQLGSEDFNYDFKTPLVEEYQDRWDFLS